MKKLNEIGKHSFKGKNPFAKGKKAAPKEGSKAEEDMESPEEEAAEDAAGKGDRISKKAPPFKSKLAVDGLY